MMALNHKGSTVYDHSVQLEFQPTAQKQAVRPLPEKDELLPYECIPLGAIVPDWQPIAKHHCLSTAISYAEHVQEKEHSPSHRMPYNYHAQQVHYHAQTPEEHQTKPNSPCLEPRHYFDLPVGEDLGVKYNRYLYHDLPCCKTNKQCVHPKLVETPAYENFVEEIYSDAVGAS